MAERRAVSEAVQWREVDEAARNGRCYLVRAGDDMAVARFDGTRFVFPATDGLPLDFEPTDYQP